MIRLFFLFIFFASLKANAQATGCISLEGLKMPCFGGGVACGSCSEQYSEEQRQNACRGTLPLDNPPGCSQGITCGTKCCSTCAQYDPSQYYTCQSLPGACDAGGNPVSCGKGTKEPSCSDPTCVQQGANRCGTFTCTCGITCNGAKTTRTCYKWTRKSVPSGGSCGCRLVGATPGRCNGSPTGASECGSVPNPCNSPNEGQCLGASNQCWVCSYAPGNPGSCSAYCSVGSATCYENPVAVEVCADSCTGDNTDSPSTPPGTACNAVPPAACTEGSCPSCSSSQCN